jgi:hypothetical protein
MKKYIHIPNQKSGSWYLPQTEESIEQDKQKKLAERKLRLKFNKQKIKK